ncbi:cell division cycle 7-related protein kinase-like [Metopolophium dirhodum]|uniref:cell division cycle 7-related protein kinase-like n=1 Tax=Metopolophium dirhodum TaxID=44670 RepID=UPI00298F72B3|nr:cell division cycle 7-related protein kinase-like [Metopolophium dirhodum]
MAANSDTFVTSSSNNKSFAGETSEQKIPMKDESFRKLRETFVIQSKIGAGTFSKVYLAYARGDPEKKRFAIKHIKQTTHPEKLRREIFCLLKIGGQDNVMGLVTSLRIGSSVCLVMPYIKHDHPLTYLCSMDANEMRFYIKNLLIALKRIHSFNIVHRDVKPSNFLYNRSTSTFMLTDFGLAHPNINPTRRMEIKSLPDNKSDTSSYKQKSSSCGLNVNHKRSSSVGTIRLSSYQKRILQNIADDTNSLPHGCNLRKRTKLMMPKEPLLKENSPIKKQLDVPKNNNPSNPNAMNSLFHEKNSFAVPKVQRLTCDCVGKLKVCNICIKRPEMKAPRAGTPGFRAPEVLLKYKYQNTALDIWSVGVIMLEAMSRCYPFFSAENDSTCLAEMITVFGDRAIKNLAKMLGRNVICEVQKPPLDLRAICRLLCHRSSVQTLNPTAVSSSDGLETCNFCMKPIQLSGCEVFSDSCSCYLNVADDFPYPAYDLLKKLLCLNPVTRITADIALKHPFFKMNEKKI